jgi:hypothetical protein
MFTTETDIHCDSLPKHQNAESNTIKKKPNDNNQMLQDLALTAETPLWFQEYVQWHRQQLSLLQPDNWHDFKFLLHYCRHEKGCGGTADRLKAVPLVFKLAAKFQRIVFYAWEKPYPLESFLVPVTINWTLPEWLDTIFQQWQVCTPNLDFHLQTLWSIQSAEQSNQTVIRVITAFGVDGGEKLYNHPELVLFANEPKYQDAYHPIWSALFRPSPAVQKVIQAEMQRLQLTPNQYNALHIRSQYLLDETQSDVVVNATKCALHHFTGLPWFIATDSLVATQRALDVASNIHRLTLNSIPTNNSNTKGPSRDKTPPVAIARSNKAAPLHLDRGYDFFERKECGRLMNDKKCFGDVTAYYDIFVDLYLLAQAKCLVYGIGGYGMWANLLSSDPHCSFRYYIQSRQQYIFPPSICGNLTM